MKCCPECGRPFAPEIDLELGHGQRRHIYEIVAKCPDGISTMDIADKLYADHPDGGPETANKIIHVRVHQINKILAAKGHDVRIIATGGHGSVYRLGKASESWRRFTRSDKMEIAKTPGTELDVGFKFGVSHTSVHSWRKLYGGGA